MGRKLKLPCPYCNSNMEPVRISKDFPNHICVECECGLRSPSSTSPLKAYNELRVVNVERQLPALAVFGRGIGIRG